MLNNKQSNFRLERHLGFWVRPSLAAVCMATLLAGCGSKEEDIVDQDPVVIEVGERTIRLSEIQSEIDFLKSRGVATVGDPEGFIAEKLRREVALQEARELGLDKDPELQRQIENLLIGRLKQQQLALALANIYASDEELEAQYEVLKHKFGRPAQARMALLFLPASKFMDSSAREALKERMLEGRELAQELPSDATGFGELAMRYSEEPTSRFKGGDVGWMETGRDTYRWPNAVVETAFALPVGEMSDVIETDTGFYLLKKTDSREASYPTMDGRFAATVEQAVRRQKRESVIEEIEQTWSEGVEITLNEDVIERLDFDLPQTETSQAAPAPLELP